METVEDVKALLESYKYLLLQVKSLKKQCEDYDRLIAETGGIRGVSQDGMPHGNGKSDPISEVILNAEELKLKYTEKLKEKLDTAKKIETLLNMLGDDEQFILRSIYVDGLSIYRVAKAIPTSEATVYRKKDMAIKKILKKIKIDSP